MKKMLVLLATLMMAASMAAHAADAETKLTPQQAQVKKLRAQADAAHKKGDALTAKADKLESEPEAKPGEKMRGCTPTDSTNCGKKAKNVSIGGVRG